MIRESSANEVIRPHCRPPGFHTVAMILSSSLLALDAQRGWLSPSVYIDSVWRAFLLSSPKSP
jgi:hypothetical protein